MPLLVYAVITLVCPMPVNHIEPDPTIRHQVRIPDPRQHLAEVEVTVPTGGREQVELMMPVWTPGSYLVREYARHVEGFTARDAAGKPLRWEKTRKNRWRIETGGAAEVTAAYRLYCREMGVQTNWVDQSFALFNGAATFLTLPEALGWPHEVTVHLPAGWERALSGLETVPGPSITFRAGDYDELVDCPIYAGSPRVYEFEVDGKPHLLVNEGEKGIWDGPRSARDVETIVKTQRDFWGQLPYGRYLFLNILSETGGGLEHRNSTVLMSSRFATRTRASYVDWLTLVSHEYFHTWNVKRLRPVELGPFDYEGEVHTTGLWIAEGLTSYYDRLLVRRAGLCTADEYLAGDPGGPGEPPKSDVERLQATHGRLVQPLETASFDAWIKFYRRDENTANTAISYYLKGAVVGWLLDARIREATAGAKSLDDLMRAAYSRYSGERGFTSAEFRALASEVADADLSGFFRQALETIEELDYAPALGWFGLRFKPAEKPEADAPAKAWLGLDTRREEGRLLVSQVRRDGPAFRAGVNVGDELLAFDDERIRAETFGKRLEQYRPGDAVRVLVARRDHLLRLDATLGEDPGARHQIEIDPAASPAQVARRKVWLRE